MPEVDQGELWQIRSSGGEEGETPSAGPTVSAEADRAFSDSGCGEDAQETYEHFIALRYSYAIAEDTAREGYTLHGNHRDDLPVEVITTDASEHGANAGFAGMYSHEIRVSDRLWQSRPEQYRKYGSRPDPADWYQKRKCRKSEKSGILSGRRSFLYFSRPRLMRRC